MHRNLTPPTHSDVVERPLALEPREGAPHGLALLVQRLPFWGPVPLTGTLKQPLVLFVEVDNRRGCVLPLHQVVEGSRRVPRVGQSLRGVASS